MNRSVKIIAPMMRRLEIILIKTYKINKIKIIAKKVLLLIYTNINNYKMLIILNSIMMIYTVISRILIKIFNFNHLRMKIIKIFTKKLLRKKGAKV
jgi:hypothetical protein